MSMAQASVPAASSLKTEESASYDSDNSEDGPSALALRRREASDVEEEDEEGEEELEDDLLEDELEGRVDGGLLSGEDEEEDLDMVVRSRRRFSDDDAEDEDEGAAEEEVSGTGRRRQQQRLHRRGGGEDQNGDGGHDELGLEGQNDSGNRRKTGDGEGAKEEEKEIEPFVVPTAGAFYMHDDRFREHGGARPRRGLGGRRLWEARDEKPWVHDLFQEFSIHDDGQGGRRKGRGASRGRGRGGRGRGRGQGRGRGLSNENEDLNKTGRPHQNEALNNRRAGGIGRGLRSDAVANHYTQELAVTNNASQRARSVANQSKRQQVDITLPKKLVSLSNLNSSSPPFYPSGALHSVSGDLSNKDGKKEIESGQEFLSGNFVTRSLTATSTIYTPQTIERPLSELDAKPSFSGHAQTGMPPHFRDGPGEAQDKNVQGRARSYMHNSTSQGNTVHGKGAQRSSGKHSSGSTSLIPEAGDVSQPSSSDNRSKSSGNGRVGGRGGYQPQRSFVYNGGVAGGMLMRDTGYASAQVMAPGVLQYGNQPQSGLVVPAMGMAMPSFPSQPHYGYGGSEIAWVPVLAGSNQIATGFGSPYMAVDGAASTVFYAPPPVQPTSFRPAGYERV